MKKSEGLAYLARDKLWKMMRRSVCKMLSGWMMTLVFCANGTVPPPPAGAVPSPDMEEVVRRLFGFASIAEAGEEMWYELERLREHPVRVNEATADVLNGTVLFSAYQAAALLDYRRETGPLLSATELGQVDGFDPESAPLYAAFLDFSLPGRGEERNPSHQLHFRGGVKGTLDRKIPDYRAAMRYSGEYASRWSIRAGCSWPAVPGSVLPSDLTGNLTRHTGRADLSVGDLHLRFGQGVVLWTGLSFTTLPSALQLMKNAGNLCIPDSWSGNSAVTGTGAEVRTGPFLLTGALALPGLKQGSPGLLPALNFSWYGRRMKLGHSLCAMFSPPLAGGRPSSLASSVDLSACFKGTDFFAELGFDWLHLVPAFTGGCCLPLAEGLRMAFAGRYYPPSYASYGAGATSSTGRVSNEYGVFSALDWAFPGRRHDLELSGDLAGHPADSGTLHAGDLQVRAAVGYNGDFRAHWHISCRYSMKWRDNMYGKESRYAAYRTRQELRMDLKYGGNHWRGRWRTHLQYSRSFSFLTYVEGGFESMHLRCWLRQTFFLADSWEDRIYAYERDFPGSFSVPAYYGRGLSTALYLTADLCRWCRTGVKAGFTAWPWNEKEKPGRAGLRFIMSFRF